MYNEARTVNTLLHRVVAAPYEKQIIVVNDASTDGTDVVLQRWANHTQCEVVHHERNRGKGAAIRSALERAQGTFAIIQDADLEYDPNDYPLLIEPLRPGHTQVVYGSRYSRVNKTCRQRYRLFRYGVWLLNIAVWCLYGVRLTDEATCYKAFRTALLKKLKLECDGFDFCPEVTAKLCRMGIGIYEVPISYRPRCGKEGKKIAWRDGLQAFQVLWKWRNWQVTEPSECHTCRAEGSQHSEPQSIKSAAARSRPN